MILRFSTTGIAITQGSKSAFVNRATGRAVMREGSSAKRFSALQAWRTDVAAAARDAYDEAGLDALIGDPVAVAVHFTFLRPASHPKRRRTWAVGSQGDIDKLVRAVLDAMTGTLIADDKQVVALAATKDFGNPPGVVVSLSTGIAAHPAPQATAYWEPDVSGLDEAAAL